MGCHPKQNIRHPERSEENGFPMSTRE